MFCDEPFTPGHQPKRMRGHLYLMNLDEEENSEEPIDNAGASEHTVEQLTSPQLSIECIILNF